MPTRLKQYIKLFHQSFLSLLTGVRLVEQLASEIYRTARTDGDQVCYDLAAEKMANLLKFVKMFASVV